MLLVLAIFWKGGSPTSFFNRVLLTLLQLEQPQIRTIYGFESCFFYWLTQRTRLIHKISSILKLQSGYSGQWFVYPLPCTVVPHISQTKSSWTFVNCFDIFFSFTWILSNHYSKVQKFYWNRNIPLNIFSCWFFIKVLVKEKRML